MKNPYKTPKYWYHISTDLIVGDDGSDIFYPKLAENSCNRVEDEPIYPRFCVTPTIPQCMLAVSCFKKMYVYRSVNKIKPVKPFFPKDEKWCQPEKPELPFDMEITNEGWVVRKTQFKLIGMIELAECQFIDFDTDAACNGSADFSKKNLTKIRKTKNAIFYPVKKNSIATFWYNRGVAIKDYIHP